MSLTIDEVLRTAHLAHLNVLPEQTEPLQNELNNILGFVDLLKSVDTEQVEPLAHPLEMSQPLRKDAVTEPNLRDSMQAIAPETHNGLYLVLEVIASVETN